MATGTIVYCSREDHTPPPFAGCLARLAQRHPDALIRHMIGNDIADLRNQAVWHAQGDWVWFIDTDMFFAPETLDRLLVHQVPVVQVLCLKRHPPHEPILWSVAQPQPQEASDPMPVGPPRLVEVRLLGAGGTLYRRSVFEQIAGPWFEGILGKEDINFARKISLAGFPLYVDLATPVRHVTPMAVYPKWANGRWYICYESSTGEGIDIPFEESRLIAVPPSLVS